ncbi:MAG: hypothetical protein HC901_01755 [Bdellovibrionaceae bacterium]|nr:hypothetical protein [Pseudobdellovibrionaceae bacterium]
MPSPSSFDAVNRYDHGYVFHKDRPIQDAEMEKCFRDLLEREREQFAAGEIALMHGMDTSTPDIREDAILRRLRTMIKPGETLFYSSLPRYAAAILEKCRGQDLPRVTGEARHTKLNDLGFSYIANDIISARVRQKLLATRVENTLIRQTEPFAAMALLNGSPWPERYLTLGWKQLLKCHPHDTVGGCGIDRMEEDAGYRLRDCLSVCSVVSSESLMAVQAQIDTARLGHRGIVLTVFNPTPRPRSEMVEAFVDVPRELEMQGFSLSAHDGTPAPFSIEPTGYFGKVFRDHADLALQSYADETKLRFLADAVPPLGYKVYFLTAGNQAASTPPAGHTSQAWILENNHLRAEVQPNGSVNLTDKATGHTLEGLNVFEDSGEVGHAWSHVQPADDLVITSKNAAADLSWIECSPVRGAIRAGLTLQIPANTPLAADRFDWRATTRKDDDLRPLKIDMEYSLPAGSRSLQVAVRINNQSRNHRLRALFPTGIRAEFSYAEAPFDVVTRHIRRTPENPYAHLTELPFPMNRFAGVAHDGRNFTFFSGGLKEYEALEDDAGTLAVTLFRAYENRFCTAGDYDLESRPGDMTQIQGDTELTYRLYAGPAGDGYSELLPRPTACMPR